MTFNTFVVLVTRFVKRPVAQVLCRLGLTANQVSVAGFLISAAGTIVMVWPHWFLGATILFTIGSLADLFDGEVARLRGEESNFGAWVDAVMQYMSGMCIYLGLGMSAADSLIGLLSLLALFTTDFVSSAKPMAAEAGIKVNWNPIMIQVFGHVSRVVVTLVGLYVAIAVKEHEYVVLVSMLMVLNSYNVVMWGYRVRKTFAALRER